MTSGVVAARRRLLASSTAICAAALAGCSFTSLIPPDPIMSSTRMPPSRQPGAADAELFALLDRMFEFELQASPEQASRLGLDAGARAALKHRLDDRSAAAARTYLAQQQRFLQALCAIDARSLGDAAALDHAVVVYQRRELIESADRFDFGVRGGAQPYLLSQLTGAYQSVPDFLDSKHAIASIDDAHAYLLRLGAFSLVLDQETARARDDAQRGVIPPAFVVQRSLQQLKRLRDEPPVQSSLVRSLVRRAAARSLVGDWHDRAVELVATPVSHALDRQIALLESWLPHAPTDAGVWRLPDGEAYYQHAMRLHTTTTMTADEIHRCGVEQVAEISARIDEVLRGAGMASGSIAQRLAALGKDARFAYPNTEDGKEQLLADLRGKVDLIRTQLPAWFDPVPAARLEVKRVPQAIEAGAPRGYYQPGSLDGSQAGAFYVNLRDTAQWRKLAAPTFAFHEGVPGHHLQGSLTLEAKDVSLLRKTLDFNAYAEGWALYAEQLADEMGLYDDDPFGRVGYLQSMLFRAVRLVVDTGIHAGRWPRDRAVQYMVETLGEARGFIEAEVARYCVVPGQALGYKIGHLRWLALRESARSALGPRFDRRAFHREGLGSGPMPLHVLDDRMQRWLQRQSRS